jgi:hypothetical protein
VIILAYKWIFGLIRLTPPVGGFGGLTRPVFADFLVI